MKGPTTRFRRKNRVSFAGDSFLRRRAMPWFRNHYYCESCDGTWLVETELVIEGDCPFCEARDVFPYKNDSYVAGLDAPTMARRLAATMRRAVGKSAHTPQKPSKRPARMAS
jgi:hypothetical protein